MKRMIAAMAILFSINANAVIDITCLGSHPELGNIKLEIDLEKDQINLLAQQDSEFISVAQYSTFRGAGMLGNTKFTHIISHDSGQPLIDFQLNIYPQIEGADYAPLSFYKAPYHHSTILYRPVEKAVNLDQLYNDQSVIDSNINIVCKTMGTT